MKLKRLLSSLALLAALAAAPAHAAGNDWLEAALAGDGLHRFDAAPPPGTDPLAAAIVEWDRLRNPAYSAEFPEVSGFLLANSGWPQEATIRARAERAVGPATPMADRLAYFAAYPPQGGGAVYRLAEAYAATGRTAEANAAARRAWTSASLPAPLEADLLARFGATLTADDHARRADVLLWSRQTAAATRLLALLPEDRRAWASARVALQTSAPDADALVAAVPASLADDPGLLYDRARALEAVDPLGAARLLTAHAVAPGAPLDPTKWIKLRLELARTVEKLGQSDLAYRLAADHAAFPLGRPLSERALAERDAFTDIEWFAGWIALHDLHSPSTALAAFSRYQAGALSPTTRAKGLYWAARAADAGGQATLARAFLTEAAQSPETFYGQLATEKLGLRLALPAAAPIAITPADRARVAANPLARAARLLGETGLRDKQSVFLRALAEHARTPAERVTIAELGPTFGRPDLAVIVGKAGRNIGEPWNASAYPRLALSSLPDNRWSITHAITRQESQFDQFIRSHAGALGLMQLMPGTARATADHLGLAYSLSRLTSDQDYNVTLGSGYYAQLLDQWGGDNVLAVASYNAGAGNVRKWIALNGDPREPGVDVVAWIETIPFSETRTYVERVLENAVVYDLLRPGQARSPESNRLSAYLGRAGPG